MTTTDSDRTATKDHYPTWSWTSGGGGNGQYEYSTNTVNVYVDLVGNITAENHPVTIKYLDYNPDTIYETYSSSFQSDGTMTIQTTLPSTNGTKYVYAVLIDEAGNSSDYKNDSIILDTEAPTGTFSINNGATYTPSLAYKITLNCNDNLTSVTNLKVKTYDYYDTHGWDSYRTYSGLLSSSYSFSKTSGTKYAYVRIYDQAGNYKQMSDSIYMQTRDIIQEDTQGFIIRR